MEMVPSTCRTPKGKRTFCWPVSSRLTTRKKKFQMFQIPPGEMWRRVIWHLRKHLTLISYSTCCSLYVISVRLMVESLSPWFTAWGRADGLLTVIIKTEHTKILASILISLNSACSYNVEPGRPVILVCMVREQRKGGPESKWCAYIRWHWLQNGEWVLQ